MGSVREFGQKYLAVAARVPNQWIVLIEGPKVQSNWRDSQTDAFCLPPEVGRVEDMAIRGCPASI